VPATCLKISHFCEEIAFVIDARASNPYQGAIMKSALAFFAMFVLGTFAYAGPEQIASKDFKQPVVMPETCPIDWTGFHVGVHVGYGWGNGDTDIDPLPSEQTFVDLTHNALDLGTEGIFGGGQAGYDHQFGRFVLGVEADISASDISGKKTQVGIRDIFGILVENRALDTEENIEWFGTLRARVGFTPCCRLLLYVTGGLAYGEVNYLGDTRFGIQTGGASGTSGVPRFSTQYLVSPDELEFGWTGGGGAQLALNKRWSVKVEYLYLDLGDESATANQSSNPTSIFKVHYNWETIAHTVNVGLNYQF
jgi:outer membrane immunogenic protein